MKRQLKGGATAYTGEDIPPGVALEIAETMREVLNLLERRQLRTAILAPGHNPTTVQINALLQLAGALSYGGILDRRQLGNMAQRVFLSGYDEFGREYERDQLIEKLAAEVDITASKWGKQQP